jgi:hypothetical protein
MNATATAQTYRPSTPAVSEACDSFIAGWRDWSASYGDAQRLLTKFIASKVGFAPRGLVAMDPLAMTTCAVVFDRDPGPAFFAVPDAIAARLQDDGVPGTAYAPDVSTALGREVMDAVRMLSTIAEKRPLLVGAPGLAAGAIESGRLVLTHAAVEKGEIRIRALPSAVAPGAGVSPVVPAVTLPTPVSAPLARPGLRS